METRATQDTAGPSRYEQIAHEHAFVRERIGQIERELAALRIDPTRARGSWVLPELVRDLRRHLHEHFRLEESGGLLGRASRYYDPGTLRKVEVLIDQHRGFERRLDALVEAIDGAEAASSIARTHIDRDARELLGDLAQHEQTESELVHSLVTQDVGAGD